MSGNHLKTPFNFSMNRFAAQKVADGIHLSGKSLPCRVTEVISSGIVRIAFEVDPGPWTLPSVVVPVLMSRYVRLPVQIGDEGVAMAADAFLGGVTGLGAGLASIQAAPPNLACLVFCPLGNMAWSSVDLDAAVITAPHGFVLQDDAADVSIVGNASGLTLTLGSNSIALTSSGIAITGTLTINGHAYLAHEHSGVQTGSGNTGGVV